MSVLIKGIEMPEGCPFCPLSHWTRGTDEFAGCEIVTGKRYAMLNDKAFAASLAKSRPDWCPLVPVHPHGRLIDADALIQSDRMVGKLMMFGGEYVYTQAEIDRAPTIIEAEEVEE